MCDDDHGETMDMLYDAQERQLTELQEELDARRCGSCKFWGIRRTDQLGEDVERGHLKCCGNPKLFYEYWTKTEDVPDDSALIESDEGWCWFTGPRFGCVHWEAR